LCERVYLTNAGQHPVLGRLHLLRRQHQLRHPRAPQQHPTSSLSP
jgi:hypothetical protein